MKKRTVFFILIVFFLLNVNTAISKNGSNLMISDIDNQVNIINSLTLSKYNIITNNFKNWQVNSFEGSGYHEANIYLDNKKRVRKLIYRAMFPEDGEYIIKYFREDGSLCKMIYQINSKDEIPIEYMPKKIHDPNSYYYFISNGNIYFQYDKPIKLDTVTIVFGKSRNLIIKNIIPLNRINVFHLNASEIVENLELDQYKPVSYCKFSGPHKNDTTVVNINNVLVRKKPVNNSKVINTLHSLSSVKILSSTENEKWYRVSFENQIGFVDSSLLEPVEKLIH
ncbi:MAG: SH3 domain-containing protein [Deltaproteobacteria bacterium]|nr:SH3 domain-containing protein [Deltaproteobacteria bacterium]